MKKESRGSRIGIVRRLVRLKGFETSRDYLPLRPQHLGRIGFRPDPLGPTRSRLVCYGFVASFDEVVLTNIPPTVSSMILCMTPGQYLAARNLKKVEAKFDLQHKFYDVG